MITSVEGKSKDVIFGPNKYNDSRLVWHCNNRHSELCKTRHFKCLGTECRDYDGEAVEEKYNKYKTRRIVE